MEKSILKTVFLPAAGNSPAVICRARDVPLRVLISYSVFLLGSFTLAYDPNSLFPTVTSAAFTANMSDVVVLAPGQGLYGVSIVGTPLNVAISEMIGA